MMSELVSLVAQMRPDSPEHLFCQRPKRALWDSRQGHGASRQLCCS